MTTTSSLSKIEWQIAEGSRTAHVIDTGKPGWRKPDGSRRRSGPRSLCGRYPQRNALPWFSLAVNAPGVLDAIRHYTCRTCSDCADALTTSGGPA